MTSWGQWWQSWASTPEDRVLLFMLGLVVTMMAPLLLNAMLGRRVAVSTALVPPVLALVGALAVSAWRVGQLTPPVWSMMPWEPGLEVLRRGQVPTLCALWMLGVLSLACGVGVAARRDAGPISAVQAVLYTLVAAAWLLIGSTTWWFSPRLIGWLAPPATVAALGLVLAGLRVPASKATAAALSGRQVTAAAAVSGAGALMIGFKVSLALLNQVPPLSGAYLYTPTPIDVLLGWGARWAPAFGIVTVLVGLLPMVLCGRTMTSPESRRRTLATTVGLGVLVTVATARVAAGFALLPASPYAASAEALAEICLPWGSEPRQGAKVLVRPDGSTAVQWDGTPEVAVQTDPMDIAIELLSSPSPHGVLLDSDVLIVATADTPFERIRPALHGTRLTNRQEVALLVRHHRQPVGISFGFAEAGDSALVLTATEGHWVGPDGRPAWVFLDTPTPRILLRPSPTTTVQEIADVYAQIDDHQRSWPYELVAPWDRPEILIRTHP